VKPLSIHRRALEVIAETVRASDPTLETGGALFGFDTSDVIDHATTPGPEAVHGPGFFSRDRGHTETEAERLYLLDGSQWIGEWHTHPSMQLVPSELDLSTYARHLLDPDLRFGRFLTLICSASEALRITAWHVRLVDELVRAERVPLSVAGRAGVSFTR
jgi:integrative and conjugative element protein (TIGR02256 family)